MSRLLKSKQLLQLLTAQFKEILREPGVLFWGILFPILMSLGLGIAFTKKADTVRNVAVIERNQTSSSLPADSAKIATFLQNHTEKVSAKGNEPERYRVTIQNDKLGNTTFIFQKIGWQQAMVMLKRGSINIVLDEKNGQIEYHFDPLNPDAQLNQLKLATLFTNQPISHPQSSENIVPLTVVGSRYIDFLIPGLIAMGIMMSCMWGISYGIIEKRSQKLLRRMVATPMKKSHFLIALTTVRITMNFVESALLFLFAYLAFHTTIQGNIAALFTIFIAGNLAFAGLAIFISCHTARTEIGNGLINAVVFPMMILSGVFFSYHNFPDWAIPIIQKFPLTMLADGIRSIFIEGAGFAEISISGLVLTIIGIMFFITGLRIFKWY